VQQAAVYAVEVQQAAEQAKVDALIGDGQHPTLQLPP